MDAFYQELFEEMEKQKIDTVAQVLKLRRDLSRKHRPKVFPSVINILTHASPKQFEKLKFLVTKPMRTESGVAPIALMTRPGKCPHGTCTMCGGGVGSVYGDVPQSYTGAEPATLRGMRNFYDPYLMVFNRLEQYALLNQAVDKVEVIVMGGTFPATAKKYQDDFIMYTFKAMNDFSEMFFANSELDIQKFKEFFELPNDGPLTKERTARIQQKVLALKGESTLALEHERNEHAKVRCVGLTIETKPDWAMLPHANRMLEQGCTRVELGLQSVSDDVLLRANRGHTVAQSKESMRILKDLGFKINGHIMIGLPGQDNSEIGAFFTDEDFRPDMLKIYPCMVMPGTELEKQYRAGEFTPVSTDEAVKIISEFKALVPNYVRIMRVQRDIPTYRTLAGVDRTNLRQLVHAYMKDHHLTCRCIRCREIRDPIVRPELCVMEYVASRGMEFFISIEQDDQLIGFCRLRFPSQLLRPEITDDSAIIRELHVYGKATAVHKSGDVQHKGFGSMLVAKAEEICKNRGKKKLLVISGVGVRAYYHKLGYQPDGPYVSKLL